MAIPKVNPCLGTTTGSKRTNTSLSMKQVKE